MPEEEDSSTINVRLPDQQDYSVARGSSVSTPEVQPGRTKVSTLSETKTQQNSAILEASLEVSIQSKNQPLALLLKSAITGINELLRPQFGDNAIQAAVSEDNTPGGTANRIVSLSTGFYDLFKQQHQGEDANEVLTNFMATIRSGFETGFKEAQAILSGMGVLNGDIASDIDKTRELVQKGYADFEAAMRQSLSGTNNASQATSA
ncbi:hypothetical protein SKTS_20400 [Sulfurimicrobium lacus]|uniref:DUF5610 domain-containing protein n=1 Tax=Sulfurimicrobium lacus TaxID=2715678 RepID=A0A6F8VBW4_9PROT|nr:DUF5610 domain-containing protein [Sulfurimicrobium lacus]BCB27154.1 hypothetical protein SKTS_20400 [Sulfurimicrobium lacus]